MKCRKEVLRYVILITGAAILAFGLYNVHTQSQITEGGILGTTLLLQHWLKISPAVSEIVLDALCYLLGVKYLGKSFVKYAATATCAYALFYALNERIGYVLPYMGHMPLLAAVVGGVFVGVGVGLVVRAGGAAGGDDALALVISKVFKWPVDRAYMFTDMIVLLLSLTYIPVANVACSLVTVTLSSFIIGKIHRLGKGKKKRESNQKTCD